MTDSKQVHIELGNEAATPVMNSNAAPKLCAFGSPALALGVLGHKIHKASDSIIDHWRAILAEFLGTAMLIYISMATSIHSLKGNNDNSLLEGALSTGGALTTLIFALGHVSGGHLNPAVTLAIMIVRAMPVKLGVVYWIAQILGSLIATGLFIASLPINSPEITESFLGLAPSVPIGSALLIQVIVSGLLCLVVLATAVDSQDEESRKTLCPIPIGVAVSVGILVAGPLIGASMNPSGAIGAVVIYNKWAHSWLYIVGPMIGSLIFGLSFKFVFMTRESGASCLRVVRKSISARVDV